MIQETVRQRPITPGVIYVWNCQKCNNVLGVVKKESVEIRHKEMIVQAVFPVLRKCQKCSQWNYCAGPEKVLTGLSNSDNLSSDFMQTLPRLTPKVNI